jgi:UDP-2,4-diacetamido-2,4,6-trideoxy-beta-L-altropyranose hydrolase
MPLQPHLRRVAFRVDASAEVGAGHLTRCVALAQALRATSVRQTFVCAHLPEALESSLLAMGFAVARIPTSPALDPIADCQAFLDATGGDEKLDLVVADHYGLDDEWESRVRAGAARVLVIDDLADRRHEADWLLDQNLQSSEGRYESLLPASCRQLLGPRFALLRPEFRALRAASAQQRERRSHVVLFAGGGDPQNVTAMVLDAWQLLAPQRPPLDVVIGAAHPHREALLRRCEELEGVNMHVQTERMAELLDQAKLLIGAAGTVSWERCCLGVPALMFAIAANQEMNLTTLAARRTGLSVGSAANLEATALSRLIGRMLAKPGLLRRMGRRAANLVDGLGADRVALALFADDVALRAARADDDIGAWHWRNHPVTRRFFRVSKPVALAEHRAWWAQTIANPARRMFISHCAGHDVGVLRLDLDGDSAEISIYLNPAFTGLGLGPRMLRALQGWTAVNEPQVRWLRAQTLPGNRASEDAFARAGFGREGSWWSWEVQA